MAQWSTDEARALIRRAKTAKTGSDEIYREAMQLTFPDRENFEKRKEGQDNSVYNWDSASTVNVIRAANRLSSDFTPQFMDWMEIGLGPAALAIEDSKFAELLGHSKEDAKRELEQTTKIVQAVFNGPGFPTASNELYIDWHYGQGGMSIMPNEDMLGEPVVFTSLPLSHFYAYEGPNNRLDRWFFWHEIEPRNIINEWKDAKLPPDLEKLAADAKQKPTPLVSVVYRDYGEKKKPWRYEVFWSKANDTHRLVERQYRNPAFVTPRHTKLPGENRGRGPMTFALPDIRTANKIVEMTLRSVALAVSGVYTATDGGIMGPVNIKPLSIIRVRSNGGPSGPSLQRLDNPQRIDWGELILENLHENIKKVIGDSSLPPEMGPIRTATEFIERARELVADQGGGLGRLLSEFIIPAVQRVVGILEDKQILATDGLKIDQFLVEVRMKSPLAKGQAMREVENVVRFVEMLLMMAGPELGPQLAATELNMEKVPGHLADLMDIPMDVRNDEAQRKKVIKGMAQVAAGQMGADPEAAGQAMDQAQAEEEADA
jgi:hypothetical protein